MPESVRRTVRPSTLTELDRLGLHDYARWVRVGTWITIVGYLAVLAVGLSRPPEPIVWVEVGALGLFTLALLLGRRGRIADAAIVVLGTVWLESHASLYLGGELTETASLAALPLVILGAGFLLPRGGTGSVALVTSLTAPGAVALSGWLGPGPGLGPDDVAYAVVLGVCYVGTALLVVVGMESFGVVVARARESEQRLQELFDNAPDGILSIDTEGRVEAVNPAAETILGRPAACLLGRPLEEIGIDPAGQPVGAEGAVSDIRVERPDGRPILLECSARRTPVEGGESVQLILRDVTQRRRTEELATQLGHIVEGAQNEIYVFDATTFRLLLVNRGARRNLGYALPDLLGAPAWLINPGLGPDQGAMLARSLDQASAEVVSMHGVHVRRDGSQYPVDLLLQSGRLDRKSVVIAFAVDASARLRAESDQRQLQSQLLHAQKMEAIGLLAGGVAHDFNNLLTVIAAGVEVLEDELPRDPGGVLQELRRAAGRGTTLTRQLLTFARREVVQPRLVDLGQVTAAMEPLLRRLVGARITLGLRTAGPAPVVADEGQLEQVLLNLVANARDASGESGEIRISVGTSPDRQHAVLRVEDDGRGIDPQIRDRIFDPFFTTKREGEGTGLGLATVHGIVHQAGGRIDLVSELGIGTRIEVWWPSAVDGGREERTREDPLDGRTSEATVLVAEDNEGTRHAVTLLLERIGYRVVAAEDGGSALERAAELGDELDVLLTDLVMPDTSGVDLARRIRETRPKLPVVFMSGYLDHRLREYVGETGVDQILLKPFGRVEVREHIERALARSGGPWLRVGAS